MMARWKAAALKFAVQENMAVLYGICRTELKFEKTFTELSTEFFYSNYELFYLIILSSSECCVHLGIQRTVFELLFGVTYLEGSNSCACNNVLNR